MNKRVRYMGNSIEPKHGSTGIAGFDPYWECWIFQPDGQPDAYYINEKELQFLN